MNYIAYVNETIVNGIWRSFVTHKVKARQVNGKWQVLFNSRWHTVNDNRIKGGHVVQGIDGLTETHQYGVV